MNTKNMQDKAERKKLKREARRKAPPKAKRTEPRGSKKQSIRRTGPAQRKR